jgi:hypothetical protein
VLFRHPFLDGVVAGTVTQTFRRWHRPAARPGSRHRTPVGLLEITAVEVVDRADLTEDDARRAGHRSLAAMLAMLDARGDAPIHRVTLRFAGADPRVALRSDAALTAEDVAELDRRLARYDRASSHGPWTAAILTLIAGQPGVRAPDLAAQVGRETQPFKVDVRKLKELGLTESLEVGYRLSPRGEAYLHYR